MLNYIYDQYARCNKYINRLFLLLAATISISRLSFSYSFFSRLRFCTFFECMAFQITDLNKTLVRRVIFYTFPVSMVPVHFIESNRFYRTHEKWTTWATWMRTINIWKHIRFTVGRTDRPNQYSLIFLKIVIGLFSCCFASSVYIPPSPFLSFSPPFSWLLNETFQILSEYRRFSFSQIQFCIANCSLHIEQCAIYAAVICAQVLNKINIIPVIDPHTEQRK